MGGPKQASKLKTKEIIKLFYSSSHHLEATNNQATISLIPMVTCRPLAGATPTLSNSLKKQQQQQQQRKQWNRDIFDRFLLVNANFRFVDQYQLQRALHHRPEDATRSQINVMFGPTITSNVMLYYVVWLLGQFGWLAIRRRPNNLAYTQQSFARPNKSELFVLHSVFWFFVVI